MSKHQCPIRLESHHDVKTSVSQSDWRVIMMSKHQCPIRFESHRDVKTSVTNQIGESSWCQNISVQADWRVIMI